jgi:hypothetical protein
MSEQIVPNINSYIENVINHVEIILEKALSKQRELHSIIISHFGKENVSITFNPITPQAFIARLEKIVSDDVNSTEPRVYSAHKRIYRMYLDIDSNLIEEPITSVHRIINYITNQDRINEVNFDAFGLVNEYNMLYAEQAITLFKEDLENLLGHPICKCIFTVPNSKYKIPYLSRVAIYFKESTLTNERGAKHTIYDSYLLLALTPHCTVYDISFLRGKLTPKEIEIKYYHSHVHISSIGEFGQCCFGSSPLHESFVKLKSKPDLEKDTVFIKMFLMQLEQFMEIESIDGGPYVLISRLNETKRLNESNITAMLHLPITLINFTYYLTSHNDSLRFISTLNDFGKTVITCGLTFQEKVHSLTNLFIDFCKDQKLAKEEYNQYLFEGIIYYDHVSIANANSRGVEAYTSYARDNKKMITFNDHDVDLEIIPCDVPNKYKVLFNPNYIPKILALLTTYINLNFKRN